MEFDPKIHHRRSIRLRGFDYARSGWYFITVVVHHGFCLFGDIENGAMVTNDAGRMIESVWKEIPIHYSGIGIDAFQIMPNHFHGIITIGMSVGADLRVCPNEIHEFPSHVSGRPQGADNGHPQGGAPTLSLPNVVQRFKSMTTRRYIEGVRIYGWPSFHNRLWQRNYFEHIIRNDIDLSRVCQYIRSNPEQWADDTDNPLRLRS